jgi:hypothetical protein
MKRDRFLLGILIFIGLLAAAAVLLFFVRGRPPAYGTEDTPAGVLHNYAVALQLHDYDRAYGYLAEKDNKPSRETFRQAFLNRQLDVSTAGLQIGRAQPSGADEALVDVTILYGVSGPFTQVSASSGTAMLARQNGAWRISSLPFPYWGWDWYQPTPGK